MSCLLAPAGATTRQPFPVQMARTSGWRWNTSHPKLTRIPSMTGEPTSSRWREPCNLEVTRYHNCHLHCTLLCAFCDGGRQNALRSPTFHQSVICNRGSYSFARGISKQEPSGRWLQRGHRGTAASSSITHPTAFQLPMLPVTHHGNASLASFPDSVG